MISVFIVDDHAVLRSGLRLLIDGEPDMRVVGEAPNGFAALEALADQCPDVLLLDISMPGISGIEVINRIRRQPEPTPKILILTMHPEADYLRPALDAGASGYVVKSVADDELLDAIRTVYRGFSYLTPEAVAVLLDDRLATHAPEEILSEREIEVLRRVAYGYTNSEIGDQLFLSPKTVDTYRRRVMQKLELDSRADLVDYALKHGLLKPHQGLNDDSQPDPAR
jgi:two-component system response regulator NreC